MVSKNHRVRGNHLKNKSRIKKLHTQYSLNWSLEVGTQLGTLNLDQAIQLANVKPAIFHRWISGTLAAPTYKLDRIKYHAFATSKRKHRKQLNQHKIAKVDEEIIIARLLWKQMIFDQLRMVAKRRFCYRLKKIYR